jgi:hypothetical protein
MTKLKKINNQEEKKIKIIKKKTILWITIVIYRANERDETIFFPHLLA